MGDASGILAMADTGAGAIAAETEAIELLLKSKRINPKAGGGGGTSPGGGGQGTTNDSALALVGTGVNEKESRERREVQQAVGENWFPVAGRSFVQDWTSTLIAWIANSIQSFPVTDHESDSFFIGGIAE